MPGNHDVLFEKSPERYLVGLGALPATPPYVWRGQARNGRPFVLYGIDSNAYGEGNIAVGRISPECLGWLAQTLAHEEDGEAVRIVLLHHHPRDLNQFRSQRSLWDVLLDQFTTLEEGQRLLEMCRGRVDVIMHGHEHFPIAFKDKHSGCVIVSAGTTSEWQEDPKYLNSFHVLVFRDWRLRVIQFNWNGARFGRGRGWIFGLRGTSDVEAAA